jgi:hypothetical protein
MPEVPPLRLNQLLLEREALFVQVHDLEQAAARLLGEPYPFIKPPLPSDLRRKPKAATRPSSAARSGLRPLEEGETVFRVTYRHRDREVTEEHDDLSALRSLWAAQGARLSVLRVETLSADRGVNAVLYVAPAESV